MSWILALQLCGPEQAVHWLDGSMEGQVVECESIELSGNDQEHLILRTTGSMATGIRSGRDPGIDQTTKKKLLSWVDKNKDEISVQCDRIEKLMA